MICIWIEFIWFGWEVAGVRGWGGGYVLLGVSFT